jgi:hypothetical protein
MFVANARSMNDDFDNKLNIIISIIRLLVLVLVLVVVFEVSSSGCCELFFL